ncbi:MAG TPA: alpha/beta hydrolase [Stenomitos sp.]
MRRLIRIAGLSLGVGLLVAGSKASAAERLVLNYGPLSRSLPISSLENLVTTGKPDSELAFYLALAKQKPDHVRQGLSQTVAIDPELLDTLLDSPVGNLLLSEMGQYVHAGSPDSTVAALRSAFRASATGDQRISLLEILQNFPLADIDIDVDQLLKAYERINRWVVRTKPLLPLVRQMTEHMHSLFSDIQ